MYQKIYASPCWPSSQELRAGEQWYGTVTDNKIMIYEKSLKEIF